MASNSRARYSYRERAEWLANKQKYDELKAEGKKMENTEANFPTLSTAHPVVPHLVIPPGGYADLAKKWATSDEDTRKAAERASRFHESEYETAIFPIRRYAPNREPGYVCDYEEPTPSEPAPDSDLNREEDRGWTVVQNRKTHKPKRELTIDEMDERERRRGGGSGGDADFEFNDELYESNRHDHDRV